jgi:hypothetical protein
MGKIVTMLQITLKTVAVRMQELFVHITQECPAQATVETVTIPTRGKVGFATFSNKFNSTEAVQKKGKQKHWIGCHGAPKSSQYGLRWVCKLRDEQ